MRGRYTPPNSKYYDVNLRNIVRDLLQLQPKLRPDLKTLLQRPVMKESLKIFLKDIFNKKSTALGAGTMVCDLCVLCVGMICV